LPDNGYKYKFGDKEWNDELGLDLYDFGARNYDPAIGRWVVQDPVIHHDYSPYSAFDNNPVYWSDPSEAYSILFQSQSSHSGRGEAVIIMKLHQYQEAGLERGLGGDIYELQHRGALKPASIIYAGPNPFGN